MVYMKDKSSQWMWQKLHRERCKMLPLLGTFRACAPEDSSKEAPKGGGEFDQAGDDRPQPRDVFTRTVASLAVPTAGVPDLDFLRRRGLSLPSHSEVTGSQRLQFANRICLTDDWTSLPSSANQFGSRSKATRKADKESSEGSYTSQLPRKSTASPADVRRQNDFQRMMTLRRRCEAHEMHSRVQAFEDSLKHRTGGFRPPEHVVKKRIFEALGFVPKDQYPQLSSPFIKGRMSKEAIEARFEVFDRWKYSMMSILEAQGEKDEQMIREFRKAVREEMAKSSAEYRRSIASQASEKSTMM